MKEIKCRVWNKMSKQMSYFDTPQFDWDCKDKPIVSFRNFEAKKIMLTGWTDVMLYISKKDINNKEIYEGDVCKYVYHITHGPHEEGNCEVFWDEESAAFLFDRDSQWSIMELSKVEVIGNIWKNPDLLNK